MSSLRPEFMLVLSTGVRLDDGGGYRVTARLVEAVKYVGPSSVNGDWSAVEIDDLCRARFSKEYEAFKKQKPALMRSAVNLQVIAHPFVWRYLQSHGANTIEDVMRLSDVEHFKKSEKDLLETLNEKETEACLANILQLRFVCEDLLRQIGSEEKKEANQDKKVIR